MLCENCKENEANVKYTQIINGVKKEIQLCDKCSKKLGIGTFDFNMPIDLSSFLGEFFEDEKQLLPNFIQKQNLMCEKCNMTYDEFINSGKFGCDNCYDVFSERIDPVLKNIHGANRHIGRGYINSKKTDKNIIKDVSNEESNKEKTENSKLDKLEKELKQAINEERYEDAAKIRDEIKKINN